MDIFIVLGLAESMTILRFVNKQKRPFVRSKTFSKNENLEKNKSIGSFCGQNLSLLHFNSFVTLKY